MSDPRGFLKYGRETSRKRGACERVADWNEFDEPLSSEGLKVQAARCMDCGVPFCQGNTGCPVENVIPEFNDFVHQDRWFEALAVLHSTNNFPEFTGKLCPAPCESACVLGLHSDPVVIRNLESSIIERGFAEGWVRPRKARQPSGKKVAIVGSGPSGLAAAQQLARKGHEVVVFERSDRIGGLLRYGIPDFKMSRTVLDRRLEQLQAEGVRFVTNAEVGSSEYPAARLLDEFDRVALTIGAEGPRDLPLPGRELDGIHFAMDYLEQQNRRLAGLPAPPLDDPRALSARGKRVVIMGGGDTGSDCLGTALRQGCAEVYQIEQNPKPPEMRSPQTPWPGWPLVLRTSHAHEEGGKREWSISTVSFLGEAGRVQRLHANRLDTNETLTLECDLVLIAAGFTGIARRPGTQALLEGLGLKVNECGLVSTDEQYRTRNPRVYSAGDARRGASLIVWAIAEGRRMAALIDRDLAVAQS